MSPRPVIGFHELESQDAQLLPRRETLCSLGCVNVTNVVGVNVAIAINAASINSQANALAMQYLASTQT
jgi:hypothetical protein